MCYGMGAVVNSKEPFGAGKGVGNAVLAIDGCGEVMGAGQPGVG